MSETLLTLANDAFDADVIDELNEPVDDTWASREYAGAIALLVGAAKTGKDPTGINEMLCDALGYQLVHHQPHEKPVNA